MKATKPTQKIFFFLLATLQPVFSISAWGFNDFIYLENHSKTCQTTCHEPEKISKIKTDKTQKASCRACHGEIQIKPPESPFSGSPRLKFFSTLPPKLEDKKIITSSNLDPFLEKKSAKISPPPFKMVYIPAGKFIMGSNDRWDDESPEHIAKSEAFFIDLYEVTNKDFKQYVDANQTEAPYHWPGGIPPENKLNHPVVYVNWFEADSYCKSVGKRLPSEIEWEKAARGENGYIYPWGNIWVLDKSNNPYNNSKGTKPVGSYPKGRSPYGLHDMSGNVWEWVDSYYKPHPGNEIPRPEYGQNNRVLKGGSWFDCLSYGCGISAPTFNRSFFTPEVRNNSFGFRCAKSVL